MQTRRLSPVFRSGGTSPPGRFIHITDALPGKTGNGLNRRLLIYILYGKMMHGKRDRVPAERRIGVEGR